MIGPTSTFFLIDSTFSAGSWRSISTSRPFICANSGPNCLSSCVLPLTLFSASWATCLSISSLRCCSRPCSFSRADIMTAWELVPAIACWNSPDKKPNAPALVMAMSTTAATVIYVFMTILMSFQWRYRKETVVIFPKSSAIERTIIIGLAEKSAARPSTDT